MKTIRDVFVAFVSACLVLGAVTSIIVEVPFYFGRHTLASTTLPFPRVLTTDPQPAVPVVATPSPVLVDDSAPPKKIDVSKFDPPRDLSFPEDRKPEWSKPGMDDVIPPPNLPKVMINPPPANALPTPAPTPAPSSTNEHRRTQPSGPPRMA